MDKIFRKRLGLFAGFVKTYYFLFIFTCPYKTYIHAILLYIYILIFIQWNLLVFSHLCRFFYLFLAHLTDCIIGQLHTFVSSAMYSSRHVFAVVSNSFLLTFISVSNFDWFLHLPLCSPHIWNQLVYFTSDAPNGVVPCLVRLTCWV